MNINEIDFDQLIADIREIAAENSEFVYKTDESYGDIGTGCQYFRDGKPSCLVGQGFAKQGMTSEDLDSDENEAGIGQLIGWNACDVDQLDVDWLDHVQSRQDFGEPWGRAIELADTRFGGDL